VGRLLEGPIAQPFKTVFDPLSTSRFAARAKIAKLAGQQRPTCRRISNVRAQRTLNDGID